MKLRALFVAMAVFNAVAAQTPLDDIERISTTASRFDSPALAAPLTLSWLDEQQLQRVNPVHIQQALVRIAGVNVQRGNGQEYLPSIRSPVFTGAGACGEILTAEDGIPLRAAGFCNINELFEAGTEYASSVEVLKGPGSVLYGSNALHGVINVITQDPIDAQTLLSADWGSFGYTRAGLRVGNGLSQHGVGLNLSVTDDGGYRDEEGIKQTKFHVRYRYDSTDLALTAGLSFSDLDQETAGYIVGPDSYQDSEIAQSNPNPEAFRKARATRLWVKLEGQTELANHPVKWQVTPYARDQDMTFLMHFLPGQPLEQNSQQGIGLKSALELTLSPAHRLTAGIDAEATDGSLTQFQESPTQGSAFLMATIPSGQQYDYQVDAQVLSAFFQWQWDLTTQWQFTFGARAESIAYDYTNNMLSGRTRDTGEPCGFGGCRYSRPASRDDRFNQVSPQASLSYYASENSLWYASVGQGFRAPQATELYRLQRDQVVADLDNVEATNAEIGYRFFSEPISWQLAVYHMEKRNGIIRDTDFFNRSESDTRHQGIEISANYTLSSHWQVSGALTYGRHQYQNDQGDLVIAGNDMDTAPRRLANAQLLWQPIESLDVELNWVYTDGYFLDPENEEYYAGHNVFDVGMVWAVTQNVTLTAKIANVFDREYAERADTTSFTGPRYFPGKPRSGLVGVEYSF
nr:TonB-dependent receptor [Alteromonas oceanisediminis]